MKVLPHYARHGFGGVKFDGPLATAVFNESVDPKWAEEHQKRHRAANELEMLRRLLVTLWPHGPDDSRKECKCAPCAVYRYPTWGPYSRNPSRPCLPGQRDLDGVMVLTGCGATVGDCRPGCYNVTTQAQAWNAAHGVWALVCTYCGVEVHHPPRAGCDGKQHRKHDAKKCVCSFGLSSSRRERCAICDAVLVAPYTGTGHKPLITHLKVHKKSCGFRKFWMAQKRSSP